MSEMNSIEQTKTQKSSWLDAMEGLTRSRFFHWPASINRRRKHFVDVSLSPSSYVLLFIILDSYQPGAKFSTDHTAGGCWENPFGLKFNRSWRHSK